LAVNSAGPQFSEWIIRPPKIEKLLPTEIYAKIGPLGVFMATTSIARTGQEVSRRNELISFEEAMDKLSREDRFRATVYAMNTLLVQKGVYSPEEFELQFRQFAQKQLR
jgi:hypothetical protein